MLKDIVLVLALQLVYVPILTLRTIFMVKNMSLLAAFMGFLEALIYVFGLSIVFSGKQSYIVMIVYAAGFGARGFLLEDISSKSWAIGYTTVTVNLQQKNQELIHLLRESGYGVTVYTGEGRDSQRYRLDILTKRNREEELLELIERYEPKAFIISYEPRRFKGGFLVASMKKRVKRKKECHES
ncbi:DUF2179 domain-containing protein [Geobacillus thermodenitrificans]|uniref:UPF0316 protein GTNG_0803 n=1 Tax=Geobacillus thermodenitrificans (strain NG80-2) TaxID=420246 RepID=Y803_GEOTN|nr:DUF2179 domain-containing protein [Geobacillus thermodenitrificans]A4ILH7.1 RecName: Full=UPF0316 protein GTNG_0803 [Geobacillus thermodenitrificans NG80-2]ABO66181.1 Conserved hypothetical protein [Geobacillus thermodenitrificans NG80-2]